MSYFEETTTIALCFKNIEKYGKQISLGLAEMKSSLPSLICYEHWQDETIELITCTLVQLIWISSGLLKNIEFIIYK